MLDAGRVHNKPGTDIVEDDQAGVGAEVQLRDKDPPNSAVVKSPLKPLSRICLCCVLIQVGEMAPDRAKTLLLFVSTSGNCC